MKTGSSTDKPVAPWLRNFQPNSIANRLAAVTGPRSMDYGDEIHIVENGSMGPTTTQIIKKSDLTK